MLSNPRITLFFHLACAFVLRAMVGAALVALAPVAMGQVTESVQPAAPNSTVRRKAIAVDILIPSELLPVLREGMVLDLYWIDEDTTTEKLLLETMQVVGSEDSVWLDTDFPAYDERPGLAVRSLSFLLSPQETARIVAARM